MNLLNCLVVFSCLFIINFSTIKSNCTCKSLYLLVPSNYTDTADKYYDDFDDFCGDITEG